MQRYKQNVACIQGKGQARKAFFWYETWYKQMCPNYYGFNPDPSKGLFASKAFTDREKSSDKTQFLVESTSLRYCTVVKSYSSLTVP